MLRLHVLLSLLGVCHAQYSNTQTPPEAFTFSLTQPADWPCGGSYHGRQSLWIRLTHNYTAACYNIDELAQADRGVDSEPSWCPFRVSGSDCSERSTCSWQDSTNCSNEWTATFPEDFSLSRNYSTVFWNLTTSVLPSLEGEVRTDERLPEDVTFRVFEGRNCQDVSSERPYRQWGNCDANSTTLECVDVPFNVASFEVLRTPEQNKTGGCLIAAVRGAGERKAVGLAFVAISAGVTALMVWL